MIFTPIYSQSEYDKITKSICETKKCKNYNGRCLSGDAHLVTMVNNSIIIGCEYQGTKFNITTIHWPNLN